MSGDIEMDIIDCVSFDFGNFQVVKVGEQWEIEYNNDEGLEVIIIDNEAFDNPKKALEFEIDGRPVSLTLAEFEAIQEREKAGEGNRF